MPNPRLRDAVPQPIYERLEAEAKRLGVKRGDLVVWALVQMLDAPRLAERIEALEARVADLEKR